VLEIPTGYGKSHVLCLAATLLLLKGFKVSIYFPNAILQMRDTQNFKYLLSSFGSDRLRLMSKRVKGSTPFHEKDFEEDANR